MIIKKEVKTLHILMGGMQIIYDFPNGYGASVVRHEFSYGGKNGLFELAVLRNGNITRETSVTDDVLGWLKPSDVLETLDKIKKLPKVKNRKKK